MKMLGGGLGSRRFHVRTNVSCGVKCMGSVIRAITEKSPASRTKMAVGDTLRTINGREIRDVLDYQYYSYDPRLIVELTDRSGKRKKVTVRKGEGQDLGLTFETYLMDKANACANKCLFCFVDQLPGGLRQTLYFKDDDARLSFLTGNYITLTNLTRREIKRIIELRVSPINISVHATDPALRCMLLAAKKAVKELISCAVLQVLASL